MRPHLLRSIVFGATLVPFVLFSLPHSVAAQQFDHQTCFKVKDSRKFAALVGLDMVQDQFDALGVCKVVGKAKLFCVPTEKTVHEFTVDGMPAILENVSGPVPVPDRVCYKVKCPKQDIGAEQVTDQFGTGTLGKFKTQFLCTPAVKGVPATTTTTTVPVCIDNDFDTYGENCANGPDCDDASPGVNPGASEICNAIDDDCDTMTDEDTGGDVCDTGQLGVCAAGTEACVAGAIVCQQNTAPAPEVCDGFDNDCDGAVDNGPGGASCNTGQPGVCADGTEVCVAGSLQCQQNLPPAPEICDGLDNDCNGAIDDAVTNCSGGTTCQAGSCVCPSGQTNCGGSCVNTQTDLNNCGSCAMACPPAQSCSGGICEF